jgi:hypothetical protein
MTATMMLAMAMLAMAMLAMAMLDGAAASVLSIAEKGALGLLPVGVMMTMMMLEGAGAKSGAALSIAEWDVLGPFPVGKTEVDSDVLAASGGLISVKKVVRRDGSVRVKDRSTQWVLRLALWKGHGALIVF